MDIASLTIRFPSISSFLNELPPALLSQSNLIYFPLGHTLVKRDDPVEHVYITLSGELLACNETIDGKFSTLLTMNAPTIISDLEILAGEKTYVANVAAATDCWALSIPLDLFVSTLHQDISFLWLVTSITAKKNYALSHMRGTSACRSSIDKTALFLLQYCSARAPSPQQDTVIQRTRALIASEVMVSQKTLDRCIIRLRELDYLSIVHGKIHISYDQYQRLLSNFLPEL
ncbi:Crp/Fnr family transcriptional regulator [uncultured Pseudoflavonifractor sp.]|uniref:Crp/Fnr family transcriptional regulator n=1 Tax=uncultured Pseudoflavonifractor sp. TaxID=1221379 RepID=UPI0025F6E683|nr:Crp/Fnr family transcriptional regulator [uncultured Pseudoflavonifractor sp.]